jgi:uncharacterized repeat protein (TIGR04138 family)
VTPDWLIDRDVACTKCGYNLRTLAVTARCPECGFPVLRSFIADEAGAKEGGPVDAERVLGTALLTLSRLLERNRDSVGMVLLAHRNAARRALPDVHRPSPSRADVPAAELCRTFADFILNHYGNHDDALGTLRFWRIERSEDLGEIVAGLIEAGLLAPGENDSPADFVGVCVFEELLRRP